ncbi:hypothetical protein DBB33_11275 [Chromobacterium haemolyticum]|uniref:Uncharacterized protein n=1 Tax=Chromobacterium rhizoryzae TaxID=1778675 RepID=A0AAD0W9T9_9NEIS|nr:hypothetical protein D1345_22075 [Chromobacterium rhizoryzae]PTU69978.1 hypothetical protein DBB33_11275 [Chromobacterium haemolyticum]
MLMYHLYIPLSQSFSPCLALARKIVNTFYASNSQERRRQARPLLPALACYLYDIPLARPAAP